MIGSILTFSGIRSSRISSRVLALRAYLKTDVPHGLTVGPSTRCLAKEREGNHAPTGVLGQRGSSGDGLPNQVGQSGD